MSRPAHRNQRRLPSPVSCALAGSLDSLIETSKFITTVDGDTNKVDLAGRTEKSIAVYRTAYGAGFARRSKCWKCPVLGESSLIARPIDTILGAECTRMGGFPPIHLGIRF